MTLICICILLHAIIQVYFSSKDSEKTRALLRKQQEDAMKAKEDNNLQEIDRAYNIGYQKACTDIKNKNPYATIKF
jgi:hypothetical protein